MKVLFIGLGGIGQRHLRNIKSLMGEGVELYAYRTRNAQFVLDGQLQIIENEKLNEKYSLKLVNSPEEAYRDGIKTVFICNPTSMHMKFLEEAVRSDCDIFIEKPISHNMRGIKRLEEEIQHRGNVVFVGYQNRYHPCIKKVKELIEGFCIGDIVSMRVEIGESVRNWHRYEDYRKMYACRKELGGGVIVTQIHELDYLYYLFGMPVSVYALGGHLSDLEIDVEDVADILMEYRIAGKKVPITVHEDYLQVPSRRGGLILGTDGKIEFNLLTAELYVYDRNGAIICEEKFDFERNDMFLEEMRDFLYAVKREKQSDISFTDAKGSLIMASAAKDSIEAGKIIYLDQYEV